MSPPEFSIICRTHGGPATFVDWILPSQNNHSIIIKGNQLIVDTSHNSVYRNELRVRGRHSGNYTCFISNDMHNYFTIVTVHLQGTINISGKRKSLHVKLNKDYL